MSYISLSGSIRTCKVDSGWASKIQSDRELNPSNMLCPPWNGVDTAGRPVCMDSFNTKAPGCNSAMDRVIVENALRPQYMEYVTLDASGIVGDQHCQAENAGSNMRAQCNQRAQDNTHKYTGQFGYNSSFMGSIEPNCVACKRGPDSQAFESNVNRKNAYVKNASKAQKNKRRSGF